MRFAVPAADPRLYALVAALDDSTQPIAATWRAVGNAAADLGMRRPGYHVVRVLAKGVRAARATARAALELLAALPSPYVVTLRRALGDVVEARTHVRLVSERPRPP